MDKFISHDQIQVGDIIRITQTVEVTEIQKQNDSRTRFTYDGLPAGLIPILPGAYRADWVIQDALTIQHTSEREAA